MKMVVGVKRVVLVSLSEEIQQQLVGGSVDESGEKNLEDAEPVTEDEAVVESIEVLCDDDE